MSQEDKRKAVQQIASGVLTHIGKQHTKNNEDVKSAVVSTLVALASTLQEGTDDHIDEIAVII